MSNQTPNVNIDIIVLKDNKILLGLLSKEWLYEDKQAYGVPGRDLYFKETIGDCVKRNMREELDCNVLSYDIISINANYEFGNHYIGIGVVVDINEEPKMMKPEDWETWEWFSLDNIPQNLFPAAKNVIACFLQK